MGDNLEVVQVHFNARVLEKLLVWGLRENCRPQFVLTFWSKC